MANNVLARKWFSIPAIQRDRVTLALVIFTVMFAQVLLYPGISKLVTAFGANNQLNASTWFLAAEFAGFIICAGLWGFLSDRTGRRVPFIVTGAFGGAVGYAALAMLGLKTTVGFTVLIVVRFIQGCLTIGAFSLAMTMLMDLDGGHGRNMGAAGIAIGLGPALGAPIGGQLYELGPFTPLWVASGSLLLAAILSIRVTDHAPTGERSGVKDILNRLRNNPALSFPYAFGFMDRYTAGFFALIGTFYFQYKFSLDAAGAGIMLALFFIPFALLQYPMGILSDSINRKYPVVLGSLGYGGTVIAVFLAPTVWIAGATMVLLGVFGSLVSPATMALVSDLSGESDRGVSMGGFNIFGNLGFFFGFILGSYMVESFGYGWAFLAAGVFEAGIVVVMLPAFYKLKLPQTHSFG